jgi:D-inositol-3-phosphate glycosyltransferase
MRKSLEALNIVINLIQRKRRGMDPIGILLDEHHLINDDLLSRSSDSLRKRLRETITKANSPTRNVRGVAEAPKMLVDALLTYGSTSKFEIYAYQSSKNAISQRIRSLIPKSLPQREIALHAISDLLNGGQKVRKLAAWFNPMPYCETNGGMEVSQSIRNSFAVCPYPIATLLHGLSGHTLTYQVYLRLLLGDVRVYDSIICSSEASRTAVENVLANMTEELGREFGSGPRYKGRIDVIPLCVDTEKLCPLEKNAARATLRIDKKDFVMTYMGRLSPQKADLMPFLLVFRLLVNSNPRRKLLWLIAGTEEYGYSSLLKTTAKRMGISDNIKIILNVSDETKLNILGASDVCVCPSDTLQESFGLSPVEAMACGVPQIVPDWNGYRDTVTHGKTGFRIPTYWTKCDSDLSATGAIGGFSFDNLCVGQSVAIDLGKTKEYIQTLIDDEQLRCKMAAESRTRAIDMYSYKAVAGLYEELWKELSAVAERSPEVNPVMLGRPRYYDSFHHYASISLSDQTRIIASNLAEYEISSEMRSCGIYHSILSLLIKRILDGQDADDCTGPIASISKGLPYMMYELVEYAEKNCNLGRDHISRHIMWLIKHGYAIPLL